MGTFLLSPRRFSFSIYTCGNSIRANPHVHFQHPYIRNAANKQIRTYSSDIYTCGKCQTSTSACTFPASVHAECSGIAKTHVLFQHSYMRNMPWDVSFVMISELLLWHRDKRNVPPAPLWLLRRRKALNLSAECFSGIAVFFYVNALTCIIPLLSCRQRVRQPLHQLRGQQHC